MRVDCAVPAAGDWGAAKEVDERERGGGERDVQDGEVADCREGAVWCETDVEAEHGDLGDGVAGPAEHDEGVAYLLWC